MMLCVYHANYMLTFHEVQSRAVLLTSIGAAFWSLCSTWAAENALQQRLMHHNFGQYYELGHHSTGSTMNWDTTVQTVLSMEE